MPVRTSPLVLSVFPFAMLRNHTDYIQSKVNQGKCLKDLAPRAAPPAERREWRTAASRQLERTSVVRS